LDFDFRIKYVKEKVHRRSAEGTLSMSIVAPFRGLTYNLDRVGDIERVVTPPYDVISEKEQEEYYQRDAHNVIRLILGKKKVGDSDWDNRYTRAADLFWRWESEEIVVRSQFPSLYLTSIAYRSPHAKETKIRWGYIALVRIEENNSPVIRPHEKTFSFHREDRLKLMKASNAQFSPVFGLYEDRENVVFSKFKKTAESPPMISFQDRDGHSYKMWEVSTRSVLESVAAEMSSKSIVIADGHHRYETARNFRNLMRARYGLHHNERAYDFVMMYLTNIADKGLTILPSHRLLKSLPEAKIPHLPSAVRQWFDVSPFPFSANNREKVKQAFTRALQECGRSTTAIGFCHAGSRHFYLLRLKPEVRAGISHDIHPSLAKLDVLVLSRLIFEGILGLESDDLNDENIIHYESDGDKALSSVFSGVYQMAFIVNPTKIEQILEVTGSSLLMPPKSTYFYPKVLSGLVFNKIDPHETIQIHGQ
jgi:uncharacterized protein (DUF1015 family)